MIYNTMLCCFIFKGGNYLLWLKKIGYAEDPGYIRAVIRVLKML